MRNARHGLLHRILKINFNLAIHNKVQAVNCSFVLENINPDDSFKITNTKKLMLIRLVSYYLWFLVQCGNFIYNENNRL